MGDATAVAGGDRELREYIAARRGHLLRSAYLLCGDRHEADDLVQSTLVKVVLAWRRLERIGNVDAYTRRTLMSTFLSSRRRMWHREKPFDELPEPPGSEHAGPDAALAVAVRQALRNVPPRQRAVLVLRYWEDRSVQETADVLGIGEGTVKSQCSRGLSALRAALGDAVDATGATDSTKEKAQP